LARASGGLFRDTGTDKVLDLSADKCRSDFDGLQKSVDTLMTNPERPGYSVIILH
jgi:hypothetical protein